MTSLFECIAFTYITQVESEFRTAVVSHDENRIVDPFVQQIRFRFLDTQFERRIVQAQQQVARRDAIALADQDFCNALPETPVLNLVRRMAVSRPDATIERVSVRGLTTTASTG